MRPQRIGRLVSILCGRIDRYAGLRISALIDAAAENWQARLNPPPRFRARSDEGASTILQQGAPSASAPSVVGTQETRFVDLTAQREATSEPLDSKAPGTAIARP